MRVSLKWLVLASCLLLGTQPLQAPRAPKRIASPWPTIDLPIFVPASAEQTKCGDVRSAANDDIRPWGNAPIISGDLFSDIDALAKIRGRRVVVYGARLAGRRLAGLDLTNICFESSDLSRTDWRGADGRGVAAGNSDFSGALMTGTPLRNAVFLDTRLTGIRATGADLSMVRIEGGDFSGIDLRGARLTGAYFMCGPIIGYRDCDWSSDKGYDLRGADLTRAHLDLYMDQSWKLDGATVDRTIVQFLQLKSYAHATIKGPVVLESSGNENRRTVMLSPAEWRQLQASNWEGVPGFRCAAAREAVEKSVCDNDYVAENDRRLNRLYHAALGARTTTVAEQRRWLAVRDACDRARNPVDDSSELDTCVFTAYKDRIAELDKTAPIPAWLTPGREELFISSEIAPPADFQRTALYARIFPVLVASANTHLFVRVVAPDRLRAGADAWGSNGHSCGLSGPVFDFNAASGRFGALHSKRWAQGREPATREDLIRFAGDEARIGDDDRNGWTLGEYAGCGVRAAFARMTRVTVPPAQRRAVTRRGRDLLSNI